MTNEQPVLEQKFLTLKEVAAHFRVTTYTARLWRQDEMFPNAIKAGRQWLVPQSDIVAHAQRLYGEK